MDKILVFLLLLLVSCNDVQERQVVVVKKVNPWNTFGAPRIVIQDIQNKEKCILDDEEAPYIYNVGDTITIKIRGFKR